MPTPGGKFSHSEYRQLSVSQHFNTLVKLVNELTAKWQVESGDSTTLDSYTMSVLKRDGRIEGVRFLIREIEHRASLDNEP